VSNKDILKVRLKVRWITYRWREGEMIEDGEVRPEGCICKPCSDIPPNWDDIRTKFGYKTLGEIYMKTR